MRVLVLLCLAFGWGSAQSQQTLPLLDDGRPVKELPLDVRVEQLEKRLSNKTFLNIFSEMQQLQREVQQLRGEVEQLTESLQTVNRRQRQFYLDLDQRITKFEGGAADPSDVATDFSPLTAPTEVETPQTTQKPPPKKADASEKQTYKDAFETLQIGKYASAIDLFKTFLEKYPQGEYADNAQYWLAEAHFVRREFHAARAGFNRVIVNFPNSPKVKDALLKKGFIDYEEQNWSDAKKTLQDVVDRYPNTTVARLAKERVQRIRREKH